MAFSALRTITGAARSPLRKGYWCGGNFTNQIDGINFLNEAAVNPSATLATARLHIAAASSLTRGYCGGGEASGSNQVNQIDGMQFSDESAINPSASLASARASLGGVSSFITRKGYYFGGAQSRREIDGINFVNEAAINPSAALKGDRQALCGGNNFAKGYFLGGSFLGNGVTEIESFVFATEAILDPSATLDLPRLWLNGNISSLAATYIGGGSESIIGSSDDVQKMIFSSEATSTLSFTLTGNIIQNCGVSGPLGGFWGGGFSLTNLIEGVFFATDTFNAVSATLSDSARNSCAGIQPWPQY